MGNKKKMTVLDFQKYKDEGRKFSFVTAYDYTTASMSTRVTARSSWWVTPWA